MSSAEITTLPEREGFKIRWSDLAPFIALALIVLLGTMINSNFMATNNILNVITRSAFIAIIGVGATFVIATGGLDLSVGSMLAFVVGIMIMAMNALVPWLGPWAIPAGALVALVVGSLCGLLNGLIITVGRIEPFIVTLGTMGIFRAFITYLTDGGSLSIDRSLRNAYRPVYFGDFLGIPYPVLITAVIALLGAFILYRTRIRSPCHRRRVEFRRRAVLRRTCRPGSDHGLRHSGLLCCRRSHLLRPAPWRRHSDHRSALGASGHHGRRYRRHASARRQGPHLGHRCRRSHSRGYRQRHGSFGHGVGIPRGCGPGAIIIVAMLAHRFTSSR
nr:ABC transporter permease [Marinicella sp. W31]MDC2878583.1 ABC transporter permease [Marinicella sp. W31]